MYREKEKRHQAILDLVDRTNLSSQEHLLKMLGTLGFEVTQATLSRDLKELHVVKTTGGGGEYKYAIVYEITVFQIDSFDISGNLLVLHTDPGMAQAVAFRVDALKMAGILGTVAGDDTLLVVVGEGYDTHKVRKDLWQGVQK